VGRERSPDQEQLRARRRRRPLDLSHEGLVAPSRAWYFLPLCVVAICLFVFLRRTWWATVLSLSVGLLALGLAFAVLGSPLAVELGARAAVVTGTCSVIGALLVIRRTTGRRRGRAAEERVVTT
jgi:hypothetical protein